MINGRELDQISMYPPNPLWYDTLLHVFSWVNILIFLIFNIFGSTQKLSASLLNEVDFCKRMCHALPLKHLPFCDHSLVWTTYCVVNWDCLLQLYSCLLNARLQANVNPLFLIFHWVMLLTLHINSIYINIHSIEQRILDTNAGKQQF